MTTQALEALFKAEYPTPTLADALTFIRDRWDQLQSSAFELPEITTGQITEHLEYLDELPEEVQAMAISDAPVEDLVAEIYDRCTREDLYEHFGGKCLEEAPVDKLLTAAWVAIEEREEEPDPVLVKEITKALKQS